MMASVLVPLHDVLVAQYSTHHPRRVKGHCVSDDSDAVAQTAVA